MNRFAEAIASCAVLCFGGCANVGPMAISDGRTSYNEIIQSTASQQTLLNIVRVSKAEQPLFVDIGEVDEVTTVTGSISGGASGIGSRPNPGTSSAGTIAGVVGAITGSAGYSEAPTVRYIPLSGQALIAQVSTPLSVDAIANLLTSDWDFAAVLTMGIDRITPGYADYDLVMDALIRLEQYGAIIVAATQGSTENSSIKQAGLTFSTTPPPARDSLTIYLQDKHTDIDQSICDRLSGSSADANKVIQALWNRLRALLPESTSTTITLRTKGSSHDKTFVPPTLMMRSAIGVLKAAAEQLESPTIEIADVETVKAIVNDHFVKTPAKCRDSFYMLDRKFTKPTAFEQGADRTAFDASDKKALAAIEDHAIQHATLFPFSTRYSSDIAFDEEAFANYRRFMLIATSDTPLPDAYVTVRHDGVWYSILNDDYISKRTLALINQINTIQAIPSATSPPLTPTISVSGH